MTQEVEKLKAKPSETPPYLGQRLILPDFATFCEWFYGTQAMGNAGEETYTTAKYLIPELYTLLQSKAEQS